MKKELFLILAFLALPQYVFAPWAAHLVISPDSGTSPASRFADEAARRARAVSVTESGRSKVRIMIGSISPQEESARGYYLVTGKTRFTGDALNFRSILASWGLSARLQGFRLLDEPAATVEDIQPLRPLQSNGKSVIEVVLKRKQAMRSYIVWDYTSIYENGAIIMDGGLWLTYDIPAFVEAHDKLQTTRSR